VLADRDGGGFLHASAFPLILVSSKRCALVIVKPRGRDLDLVATWFDDGKLAPVLDRAYPLAELPAALAHLRAGTARGKLAITI
jgi:NADPH:quinone reductase-like Zn-dependent oxidoreductase